MPIVAKAANSSAPNRDDTAYGSRRSPGRLRVLLASLTTQVSPPPPPPVVPSRFARFMPDCGLTISFQQKPREEIMANPSDLPDRQSEPKPEGVDRRGLLRGAATLAATSLVATDAL